VLLLTIPNFISLLRVVLTPVVVILLMRNTPLSLACSLLLFTLTALTDFWDGYFARRLQKVSDLGAFIDPLADKIFVLSMFAAFAYEAVITPGLFCIFAGRDVLLTFLRSIVIARGFTWTTSYLAKSKTFLQFVVLYGGYLVLAVQRGLIAIPLVDVHVIYTWMVWVIAIITIYSAFDYLVRARVTIESIINSYKVPKVVDKLMLGVATCGFAWVPVFAPGTIASVAAMVLAYVLAGWSVSNSLCAGLFLFGLFLLGWVAATRASNILKQEDPSIIVIDEVVAMLLVFFLIPQHEPLWYLLACAVFRLYDIFKPFPINFVEKKIKGGLGIMLDDLVAAGGAVLVIRLTQQVCLAMR
jgi:CDP-diacylglycerol--glycerol-3-phosphate 3-phosphatidyltransferase